MKKCAWILCLVLCLALCGFAAAETVDSGTWGTNLAWELDDNGVLTISGEGEMVTDYEETPWYKKTSSILSIQINDGVTSIGDYAFCDCSNLTTITIPDSVTSIGTCAFKHCRKLTGVTLPNSITSIGTYAFQHCQSIGSFTIPNGMTSISGGTFYGCSNLTSVSIPESVTSIGGSAFSYCSGLTDITLPHNVISIGAGAFADCTNLTGITIPSNVTVINNNTFSQCDKLATVVIPDGVTSIGTQAFFSCDGLSGITLPESLIGIGSGAFFSCSGLLEITIPNTVTSIGSSAFYGCSKLTAVTIPEGVTVIDKDTFSNCSNLTDITLPSGLTGIGMGAFAKCSKLKTIDIPGGVNSIGSYAFNEAGLEHISLPDNVTVIPESSFKDCRSLITASISDDIVSIEDSAFENCRALATINIPSHIETIGKAAFTQCVLLQSLELPVTLQSIGSSAFRFCTALQSVTVNNPQMVFGGINFLDCPDLTIHGYHESTAKTYADQDGIPFEPIDVSDSGTCGENVNWMLYQDGDLVISGSGAMTDYVTPDSPFDKSTDIKRVSIEEGITSIGTYAFYKCAVLENIDLPDGLLTIGDYAFYDCNALQSVAIPATVTTIGDHAFDACHSVTALMVPAAVTGLGQNAFSNCHALRSIVIEDGLTELSYGVFSNCEALENVTLPTTLQSIGNYAFALPGYNYNGINPLLSITIPDTVTSIGEYAFSSRSLADVILPAQLKTIASNAFANCRSLTEIVIPEGTERIGSSAFYNNTALTSMVIPDSVTSLGDNAFMQCGIESITFGSGTSVLPLGVAGACNSLSSVTIPEGVTTIRRLAFTGDRQLTALALPSTITTIEQYAFDACAALTDVTYNGTKAQWKAISIADYNDPINNAVIHCVDGDISYLLDNSGLSWTWYTGLPTEYPENGGIYSTGEIGQFRIPDDKRQPDQSMEPAWNLTHVSGPDCFQLVTNIGDENNWPHASLKLNGTAATGTARYTLTCDYLGETYTADVIVEIVELNEMPSGMTLSIAEFNPDTLTIGSYVGLTDGSLTIQTGKTYALRGEYTGGNAPNDDWWLNGWFDNGAQELDRWSYNDNQGEHIFSGRNMVLQGNEPGVYKLDASLTIGLSNLEAHIPYTLNVLDENGELPISDSCGENLTWAFDDTTGTLTITGTGAMTDYASASDVPWHENAGAITALVLNDGITAIGDHAFADCKLLTEVTWPSALERIGEEAFANSQITGEVVIPDTVSYVGADAFDTNTITAVRFAGKDTELGGAVANPETVPVYVTPVSNTAKSVSQHYDSFIDIDDNEWTYVWAFQDTGRHWKSSYTDAYNGAPAQYQNAKLLVALTYTGSSKSAPNILDGVGVLNERLLANHQEIRNIQLPSTLRIIDDYAFSHVEYLTGVTLPEGLLSLGLRAFEHCKAMTSVTLPSSLTRLSDYTFDGCLQVPGITLPDHMTYVGNCALGDSDVAGDRTFTVNINSQTVRLLGSYNFFYDRQNTNYRYRWISESEYQSDGTYIQHEGLELNRYMGSDTEIVVDSRVVAIGNHAFCWYNSSTGNYYYNTTLEKITFPEGLFRIEYAAFENAKALKEVVLPSTLRYIRSNAFYNCPLESLTIPDSVQYIDSYAFYGTKIPEVTLKDDGVYIDDYAFTLPTQVHCSLDSNTAHRLSDNFIPFVPINLDADHALLEGCALRYIRSEMGDGTETLRLMGYYGGEKFFRLYDKIESVAANVELNGARIVADLDSHEAWVATYADGDENWYNFYGFTTSETDEFNYIMSGEGTAKITGYYGTSKYIDSFPDFVNGIYSDKPETLFSIETTDYNSANPIILAFKPDSREAKLLEDIDCYFRDPDDLGIVMAWKREGNISADMAPAVWTYIGNAANVTIPEGVKSIFDNAFCVLTDNWYVGVNGVKSVTLPTTLQQLGWVSFYKMPDLESVTFLGHMSSITRQCFEESKKLNTVSFTKGVDRIENNAFYKCSSLKTVAGLETASYIGENAFSETGVEAIILADGIEIDRQAFQNCESLAEINFLGDVEAIGVDAFSWAVETSIHIPGNVGTLNSNSFYQNNQLTDIVIDGNVFRMDEQAIYYNSQLKNFTVKGSVDEIAANAFTGNENLESLVFSGSIGTVASNAVQTVRWLNHIEFGEGLTELPSTVIEYSYYSDVYKDVFLPASLTDIADDSILYYGSAPFVNSNLFRIHAPYGSYAANWASEKFGVFYVGEFGYTYNDANELIVSRYAGDAAFVSLNPDIITINNDAGEFSNVRLLADFGTDMAQIISDAGLNFTPSEQSEWDYRYVDGALYAAKYHGTAKEITELPAGTVGILTNAIEADVCFVCDATSDMAKAVSAAGYTFYETTAHEWELCWKDNILTIVRYNGTANEITALPAGAAAIENGAFDAMPVSFICDANSDMAKIVSDAGYGFYETAAKEWKLRWISNVLTLVQYTGTETEMTNFPTGIGAVAEGAFDSTVAFVCAADSDMAKAVSAAGYPFYTDSQHTFQMQWSGEDLKLLSGAGAVGAVEIPSLVTEIADSAFSGNANLTEITIPGSVRRIGGYAFNNCSALKTVNMANGLESVGSRAFAYCTLLTELRLPDSVRTIGECLASGTSINLYLPDGITSAGYQQMDFTYCRLFVHADSDTARALGANATKSNWYHSYSDGRFRDPNDNYIYAWLDGKLYLMQGYSYGQTTYYSGKVYPDDTAFNSNVYGIKDNDQYMNGEKTIVLPSSLRDLWSESGVSFFGGATQSITFPEGLTTIPVNTDTSTNLNAVVIPRSVISINDGAFGEGLMVVYGYSGTEAEAYAERKGIDFIDLDGDIADDAIINPEQTTTILHVGETADVHDLVTVLPALSTPYALSASSSDTSILTVQGDQVTAVAPGTVRLSVWVMDHKITETILDVIVYNPVSDFDVPEDSYLDINNGGMSFSVTNVTPEGYDPNFVWTDSANSINTTGESAWISLYEKVQRTVTVTSHNGISKSFRITGYRTLGNMAMTADTAMKVGETAKPTVKIKVDSVTKTNPAGLYTLTSSDETVITVGANGTITAVGAGTATVTAQHIQDMDGSKAKSVTITVTAPTVFTLPSALKVIEEEAFEGVTVDKVVIPSGATTIGSRAFANSSVSYIVIPASVTSIADNAFDGVSVLTIQCPEGSAADTFAKSKGYTTVR